MSALEQLFNSSNLDVFVPDTSVEFPPQGSADEWLDQLQTGTQERKQAFFDEQLQFLLTLRTTDDRNTDNKPSSELVDFLLHLQVALEATYISPVPPSNPDTPRTSLLAAPPRNTSFRGKPRPNSLHPSIFPPNTPNPTPTTKDSDRRYVQSEGTLLLASIWGQNTSDNSREAFELIWSERESIWVAVYRFAFGVSFLRLNYANPLLCLTVSATLRERPISTTQTKNPLVAFFSTNNTLPNEPSSPPPSPPNESTAEEDSTYFEDVNILEGLFTGPTFPSSGPDRIFLPSSRLGSSSRRQIFPLSSVYTKSAESSEAKKNRESKTTSSHPILRKSFRKTLQTVSGFKVRMRTVFVPYVFSGDDEEAEAGGEERTVVLCVEVENTGESGSDVGFELEGADVSVGGEGASAKLIGVGDEEAKTFPLLIKSMEQYNLLYAVSFLRSPHDVDVLSFMNQDKTDLRRVVVINIRLKPFARSPNAITLTYPTPPFSSRWSCVLDLAASESFDAVELDGSVHNNVLPEPASPFPMPNTPIASTPSQEKPPVSPLAGNRRHTLPGNLLAGRTIQSPISKTPRTSLTTPTPPSTGHPYKPNLPSRLSYTPPSVSTYSPRTPTTYAPPPLTYDIPGGFDSPPDNTQDLPDPNHKQTNLQPPPTPAYPSYPPNTPGVGPSLSQAPIGSTGGGSLAPSVEIRRDRGIAGSQTPGPTMMGAEFRGQMGMGLDSGGEPIVVSVGLVKTKGVAELHPLDQFLLDIFVFNKSTWTRRFEVSVPDARTMRRLDGKGGAGYFARGGRKAVDAGPGIIPLQNRIRIGPLRPSTCQSVQMEFLALTPGLHTIDTLTLTDVESGFSMNLRSVADIVIHERNE